MTTRSKRKVIGSDQQATTLFKRGKDDTIKSGLCEKSHTLFTAKEVSEYLLKECIGKLKAGI